MCGQKRPSFSCHGNQSISTGSTSIIVSPSIAYFGELLVGQVLLEHAQADDLGKQGVRLDVEPRRQQEREDVRSVGVIVGRRDQMLQERVQLTGHQVVIL